MQDVKKLLIILHENLCSGGRSPNKHKTCHLKKIPGSSCNSKARAAVECRSEDVKCKCVTSARRQCGCSRLPVPEEKQFLRLLWSHFNACEVASVVTSLASSWSDSNGERPVSGPPAFLWTVFTKRSVIRDTESSDLLILVQRLKLLATNVRGRCVRKQGKTWSSEMKQFVLEGCCRQFKSRRTRLDQNYGFFF